jgi:hypothetical protein
VHNAIPLPQLAAEINAAHAAGPMDRVCYIGERLIAAKDRLQHGEWLPWLRANCPDISERSAQVYMQMANTQTSALLPSINATLTANRRGERPSEVQWSEVVAPERNELRRIWAELDVLPYVPKSFTPVETRHGGDVEVVAGCGGAAVYWDIVGGDPQVGRPVFRYTRADVITKLRDFIKGNGRSVVSDLTVDVARRRLAGDPTLSRPSLPSEAGDGRDLSDELLRDLHALRALLGTRTIAEAVAAAIPIVREALEWKVFDEEVVIPLPGEAQV